MPFISSLVHHATLFVQHERQELTSSLWNELKSISVANTIHDHTVFDIDTARALISWAQAPYNGNKTALLSFHTITVPAQNALLKILEEPRVGVKFILVTSNQEAIIPTLLSRLQLQGEKGAIEKDEGAKTFIATKPSERMKLPHIVILLAKKDEMDRKDREAIRAFIISLAITLFSYQEYSRYIPDIIEMASYGGDSSSSGKAILEYLALLLPQVKV